MGRHIQDGVRDLRQPRTGGDDTSVEAEFWGSIDRVKARVVTTLVLMGAVAGIAGLTWLARGVF
jgi:hypothetical protein